MIYELKSIKGTLKNKNKQRKKDFIPCSTKKQRVFVWSGAYHVIFALCWWVFKKLKGSFWRTAYVEQHPNKFSQKSLSPICHKKLFEKGLSILCGDRHYPLAPLENDVGAYAPSIFTRECRLKFINILNLAKRIIRQTRSVSWGMEWLGMWSVKITQGIPWRLNLFIKLFFIFKFK